MACLCSETRISYTNPQGNGATAPVVYRCAEHASAYRAKRAQIIALAAVRKAQTTQLCLPAPRLQLTGPGAAAVAKVLA